MTEPNAPEPYAPPPPSYGSTYGTPMPPMQGFDAEPAGPPPSSVKSAVRLLYISAALAVSSLVILLVSKNALRTALADRRPDLTADQINTAVNLTIVIGAVIYVVFLALYVLAAVNIRKAKNWARIVGWVIAGVTVLFALLSLGQAGAASVFNLIVGAINVAIIVLLAKRSSGEYFRRRS